MSDGASSSNFQPDSRFREIAEAYALDAVDLARDNFGIALDRSEESVALVEGILSRLHDDMEKEQPSRDQVETVAKMFGSYIGEVFRKHHGGEWGLISLGDDAIPGIKASRNMFWPWGRVEKRLANGPEDNVWHYYQIMVQKQTGEHGKILFSTPPARPPDPPAKKSLLGKLFRRAK